MAHILRIVTRSATDAIVGTPIELAADNCELLGYTTVTPDQKKIEYSSALRDGSEETSIKYTDPSETANVLKIFSTDAEFTTFKSAIEAAFNVAASYQERKRGNRVYVEFQLDRTSTLWQSRIKSGRLVLDPTFIDVGWRTRAAALALFWTRKFYWQKTEDTEVYLASKQHSRATGGVTIYNAWDSATNRGNYVHVLGSDVPGVLPSPMRLELYNSYNSVNRPTNIYVGQNINSNPSTLAPIIEAETATLYNGSHVVLSNAAYSAGQAVQFVIASAGTRKVASWTLNSTVLSAFNGRNVRMFAKFPTAPGSNTFFQLKVKYLGLTLLDSTAEVLASSSAEVQELGALKLPPWLTELTSYELDVELYVRTAAAGGFTLDYIHAMTTDGFTEYRTKGYGLAYQQTLVDKPAQNQLYITAADNLARGFVVKRPTDGLYLEPNVDQRFYFLLYGNDNSIDRTLTVRAWTRERRLTP